ncbi:MAG: uracil-DNA glycosylase [Nitrospinota bacterium]
MSIERLESLALKLRRLKYEHLEWIKRSEKKEWLCMEASKKSGSSSDNRVDFRSLESEVSDCLRCEIGSLRTNVVFGSGSESARLMFIGEAPGAKEDSMGVPFVGRAGKLLTDMIEAMTLSREEVYIANIIKCRPPANRDPLPSEIENCIGYLYRQIEMVNPEIICLLGKVAANRLLESELPMKELRGKPHKFRDRKLYVTYHPAYLLRNPAAKKDVWSDLKLVMNQLGIDIKRRINRVDGK